MKKLALSLLLSAGFIANNYSTPIVTTTNFGPLQVVTTDGSNSFATGIINMEGQIYLGQAANNNTDQIFINGENITTPGSGSEYFLMVNESNQIVTGTGNVPINIGSLTAAAVSGDTVAIGIEGQNYINYTSDSGIISIVSSITNSGGIQLGTSGMLTCTGALGINFAGGYLNIQTPGVPYGTAGLLSVDNVGNVSTTSSTSAVTFGDTTCATLTAGTNGANVTLGSVGSTINIAGQNINATSNNLLATDASGDIVTATGVTTGTVGNLYAGNDTESNYQIQLGLVSGGNGITFETNSGNVAINANVTGANLNLTTAATLNLSGTTFNLSNFSNINSTNATNGYVLLAVDGSGNLWSTNMPESFEIGNDNANYITINNSTSGTSGITLGSNNIVLTDTNLIPGEAGYSNVLTVDSTGKIGILVSSAAHKENIKTIKAQNTLGSLQPVAYNYKGSSSVKYGFIAEELVHNEALKHAVIYKQDGVTPMSVDYNTVFVAVTADYIEAKKTFEAQFKAQEESLDELNFKYEQLKKSIEQFIASQKLQ